MPYASLTPSFGRSLRRALKLTFNPQALLVVAGFGEDTSESNADSNSNPNLLAGKLTFIPSIPKFWDKGGLKLNIVSGLLKS